MELAVIAAKNIENRSAIIDNQIALLERNAGVETSESGFRLVFGDDADGIFGIGFKEKDEDDKKVEYDKRTSTALVVAVGLNNAIIEGQSLKIRRIEQAAAAFLNWAWPGIPVYLTTATGCVLNMGSPFNSTG